MTRPPRDAGTPDSAALRATAACQGAFNVLTGLWPLVHMGSFEAVTGPKHDKWLVRTVSGLLVTIGVEQLRSVRSGQGLQSARRMGVGTAATLVAIDVFYASRGRISKVYLLDAVVEVMILTSWLAARRPVEGSAGRRDKAAG